MKLSHNTGHTAPTTTCNLCTSIELVKHRKQRISFGSALWSTRRYKQRKTITNVKTPSTGPITSLHTTHRVTTLQILLNSLTLPRCFIALLSTLPCQVNMLLLSVQKVHSPTILKRAVYSGLQQSTEHWYSPILVTVNSFANQIFLRHLQNFFHSKLDDFFQTAVKFPEIFRFSRHVITLHMWISTLWHSAT